MHNQTSILGSPAIMRKHRKSPVGLRMSTCTLCLAAVRRCGQVARRHCARVMSRWPRKPRGERTNDDRMVVAPSGSDRSKSTCVSGMLSNVRPLRPGEPSADETTFPSEYGHIHYRQGFRPTTKLCLTPTDALNRAWRRPDTSPSQDVDAASS